MTLRRPSSFVSRTISALAALPLAVLTACVVTEAPTGHQNFASPQANPIVVDPMGLLVYVANTTSNSVSVINARSGAVVAEIPVGLEPVSLALRPDGTEL